MSQVSSVNGKQGAGWNQAGALPGAAASGSFAESGRAEEVRTSLGEDGTSQISRDRVQLSQEWPDMDWNEIMNTVLGRLKGQYPSINIVIDRGDNGKDVAEIAVGLGMGTHLVISQSFLERMGKSAEEFSRCSSVLAGIAKQLAGQTVSVGKSGTMASGAYVSESNAAFWTAGEKSREKEKLQDLISGLNGSSEKKTGLFSPVTGENKTDTGSRLSKTAAISVSKHYKSLAGARTRGQVQSILADVQRSIGNLQTEAIYGEGEERVKAGRALRSLRKLLGRGSRKISRISQEELAAMRRKRAQKRQEEQKAAQAREEMRRLRSGRAGSDYSLVREGQADEAYVKGYKQYRQPKDYMGTGSTGIDFTGTGITTASALDTGPMTGGEITAGDVTVSGSISF